MKRFGLEVGIVLVYVIGGLFSGGSRISALVTHSNQGREPQHQVDRGTHEYLPCPSRLRCRACAGMLHQAGRLSVGGKNGGVRLRLVTLDVTAIKDTYKYTNCPHAVGRARAAVQCEDIKLVKVFLMHASFKGHVNREDAEGSTALHRAIRLGNDELVELLLRSGTLSLPTLFSFLDSTSLATLHLPDQTYQHRYTERAPLETNLTQMVMHLS